MVPPGLVQSFNYSKTANNRLIQSPTAQNGPQISWTLTTYHVLLWYLLTNCLQVVFATH